MTTEEERKARRREADRRYREANREQLLERKRQYREANRDRLREAGRRHYEVSRGKMIAAALAWRAANPERYREIQQQWAEKNRDKLRQAMHRYYSLNRDTHLEYVRQWGKANPDRKAEHRHSRRARQRGATDPCQPVTAAITARRYALFGNVCCFCGAGGKMTLEHVVALAKGGLHVPRNLAPSCWRCNNSKSTTPVEAWYPLQPFFDPERWEFLQAHTGNRWAVAEQLTLGLTLPTPTPAATP